MQHLKKYDDGAEVVIIKAGEYPFVTKLPDFASLNLFDRLPENKIYAVDHSASAKFITFSQWIDMINDGTFRFPFSKEMVMRNNRKRQRMISLN